MAWSLRPPLWAVLGTAVACGLMSAAGVWQVRRGEQKARLIAHYADAAQAAPLTLHADMPDAQTGPVAATAQGEYLADRQSLLDSQSDKSVPGYNVWTPLRLADGALLIVNRGWIAQPASRKDLPALPAPSGKLEVAGLWRALPRPALRLGSGECAAGGTPAAQTWPHLVEYPTAADLQCLYGEKVLAGELLLSPNVDGGFARDWQAEPNEFPPSRHYGYAGQWFAFAATLFVLFIKLNLKRTP